VRTDDPQFPLACSIELASGIPYAQLVVFDHSGHYPFIEEGDAFWVSVAAFLARSAKADAGTGTDTG
jgi:pimeloyl-ACP methyl ester carboxylesterase